MEIQSTGSGKLGSVSPAYKLEVKGECNSARIAVPTVYGHLEHEPTKYRISVYSKIGWFKRLMLRWCFGLRYVKEVKQTLLSILLVAMFSSCAGNGQSVQTSKSSGNYDVQFLFEVDHVKVYRFYDAGRWIYFTNTNGSCAYTYHNGKVAEHIETMCNTEN